MTCSLCRQSLHRTTKANTIYSGYRGILFVSYFNW